MRQQDGMNRLHRSIEDTATVKNNDLAVYNEGVELLAAEKAEDLAARNKYGTDRWTRGTSESAAPKLYRTLTEINGYFTSAQGSDDLVQRKLRDSHSVFLVLTGTNRDLESYVPSSRRAAIPPQVEREANRLRGCLSEVTRMENRRKRRIQTLKDKARADDIRTFVSHFTCWNLLMKDRPRASETDRSTREGIPHADYSGEPVRGSL